MQCSGDNTRGRFIYTQRAWHPRKQVREVIISSGVSNAAVRETYCRGKKTRPPCEKANRRSCGLAACTAATVLRAEKDKDGPGPTGNHKTSIGLPDAASSRLNRREDEASPFSGSHCPVPVGNGALSFLHTVHSHVTTPACPLRGFIFMLGDWTLMAAGRREIVARESNPGNLRSFGVSSGGPGVPHRKRGERVVVERGGSLIVPYVRSSIGLFRRLNESSSPSQPSQLRTAQVTRWEI